MTFKYMESPIGTIIWDQDKTDIHDMFTIITHRVSIKETLEVMLMGDDPGFIDNEGNGFKVKDNPEKFFSEYLPRLYNFKPEIKTAKLRDEIPLPEWIT